MTTAQQTEGLCVVALNSYYNWLFVGYRSNRNGRVTLREARNIHRHREDESPLNLATDRQMAVALSDPAEVQYDDLAELWVAPADAEQWADLYPVQEEKSE